MTQKPVSWVQLKKRMLVRDVATVAALGAAWLAGWFLSRLDCPYDLAVWLAQQGRDARSGVSSVGWSHRMFRRDGELVYEYGAGAIDWSEFVAFVDIKVSLTDCTSAPLKEGGWVSASSAEPTVFSATVSANVRPYKPDGQAEADAYVARHGVPVFGCDNIRETPSLFRSRRSDGKFEDRFLWVPESTESWAVGSIGQFVGVAFPRASAASLVALGAMSLYFAWPRSDRLRYRLRRGVCPRCGYAGQAGVCPECGLEGAFGGGPIEGSPAS